ncbi:MAG: biotin/lipoyl-binding protein, partial [Verrucomicrobia bacterium]|nr:biotin/lipoyl-binding protein [Verrucomicrobiota bacterium]
MRKFIPILYLLLGLFACAGIYLFIVKKAPKDILVLYGNVDVRQVDLGFRVFGRVDSMPWEEGDLVCPDQLMATIDKQPYLDAVRQAEANVLAVTANLQNAERLVKRRELVVAEGVVAREDFETAVSNRDVLKANLKQAEAALGIAVTDL